VAVSARGGVLLGSVAGEGEALRGGGTPIELQTELRPGVHGQVREDRSRSKSGTTLLTTQ
jgi:hypothetical protein